MMCKNIWKEELIRCFGGWRFPCAVMLTVILYLCITMRYLAGNRVDILYCYRLVADNDLLLISYAFCSWVYAGVYCDEKRNRYDRHCLLRVPAGKLVRIRMCVCIFSGMMVKSIGIWGYLIVMRWNYPLLDVNGSGIREFGNAGWGFSELIVQNKMLLYFFIEILMAGCLAGLLCGMAFCFSLFLQEKEAAKKNLVMPVLLEVNVAEEDTKFGLKVDEVLPLLEEISSFSHIQVKGLMTIAPFVENPEENRKVFRTLKKLSVDIGAKNINNVTMSVLSMGMTGDYQVAIEEGSTMVRVGTGIFGERNYATM